MSDELVVGRCVPAGNVGGVCSSCGGLLDTREQRLCTCLDVLRGGERGVSEGELARVYTKYRYSLWGCDYITFEGFRLAVKELLKGG